MSDTISPSLGAAVIKVSPEILVEKANVVKGKISTMQTSFSDMLSSVSNSNSYWIGDASDAHRKVYKEYEPEITEIFKRLSEHVIDLTAMAGVYSDAEKAATEVARNLPTDLLS